MVNRRKQDPTESAAALFGYKLRKLRDTRGLTGAQLGEVLYVSPDLISKIETATMAATFDLAAKLDTYFDTGETFQELQPLAAQGLLPSWFRRFTDGEGKAKSLRILEINLITGLLQTEEYARQILTFGNTLDQVEQRLAARMARQDILTRDTPPRIMALMTEYAVRRVVGTQSIMKGQYEHLLTVMMNPNVSVQIIPEAAPVYVTGAFTIMSFDNEPDFSYAEIPGSHGEVFTKRERVEAFAVRFDLIRSEALPRTASADLVSSILEGM